MSKLKKTIQSVKVKVAERRQKVETGLTLKNGAYSEKPDE
jgi:hypothetical protein